MLILCSDKQPNIISTRLLELLITCIEEITVDETLLSPDILDSIFRPLLNKDEDGIPARRMAQHLITRCTNTLQPSVTKLLNNSLNGRHESDFVQKHCLELIYELNSVAPSMMIFIIPHLEDEMKV